MTKRCTQLALALSFRTGYLRPTFASATALAYIPPVKPWRVAPPRRAAHMTRTPPPPGHEDVEGQRASPWSLAPGARPDDDAAAAEPPSRFRQHVNPLSRRYQTPTELPDGWPRSDFADPHAPLYLDIGCGKGGFLLELVGRRHGGRRVGTEEHQRNGVRDDDYVHATRTSGDTTSSWLPDRMNYLGLEIRPGVSRYSRARAAKWGLAGRLSFVGCNANVDLDRLLTLYRAAGTADREDGAARDDDRNRRRPAFVSIQFPDPHFKKKHAKRGVVTPALVGTLAKHMREGDAVFLQSDVRAALEAMRDRFVEDEGRAYFDEWRDDGEARGAARSAEGGEAEEEEEEEEAYGMENPLGIPTEREVSVLKKGLPIYRTLFKRNGIQFGA